MTGDSPSPDSDTLQLLQQVLRRLQIEETWDLLIVGDGSGSGWEYGCGWGTVLFARHNPILRRFFYGGMVCGSVNLAESMPYLQALTWYDNAHGKRRLSEAGLLRVHVLTDSQTVALWGNRATGPVSRLPRKQLAIWAAMRELRRVGYQPTFHWAPRSTTAANVLADLIAGLSRGAVIQAGNPGSVSGETYGDRAARALENLHLADPEAVTRRVLEMAENAEVSERNEDP